MAKKSKKEAPEEARDDQSKSSKKDKKNKKKASDDIYVQDETGIPQAKPKKKRKFSTTVIIILILIIIFLLFKNPILSILGKIPFVGKYVPKPDTPANYAELQRQYNTQKIELDRVNSELEQYQTLESEYNQMKDKVDKYEAEYTKFDEDKKNWANEMADSNKEAFISTFEAQNPDLSEVIYSRLKGEEIFDEEQRKLIKTITTMDEDQAADTLETLMGQREINLVINIIQGMSNDTRANILNAMSVENAAEIIKLIAPDQTMQGGD